MARGGTRVYCARCRRETICRAISPTKLGKKKAQRVNHEQYVDIHWFRRGRECSDCGSIFLTGELDETFIQELVDLRNSWLSRIRGAAGAARRRCNKNARVETVFLEDAQAFIRACAYWDHPTSYSYVGAPKHARRVYLHSLGWAVDFGANTFLPGMAIARGHKEMEHIFEELEAGKICFRDDALRRLKRVISGCVATQDGHEYNGYYPTEHGYLRFGTQLIYTDDAAAFILNKADPKQLLMTRFTT